MSDLIHEFYHLVDPVSDYHIRFEELPADQNPLSGGVIQPNFFNRLGWHGTIPGGKFDREFIKPPAGARYFFAEIQPLGQ